MTRCVAQFKTPPRALVLPVTVLSLRSIVTAALLFLHRSACCNNRQRSALVQRACRLARRLIQHIAVTLIVSRKLWLRCKARHHAKSRHACSTWPCRSTWPFTNRMSDGGWSAPGRFTAAHRDCGATCVVAGKSRQVAFALIRPSRRFGFNC
jgi:hypothetical protein